MKPVFFLIYLLLTASFALADESDPILKMESTVQRQFKESAADGAVVLRNSTTGQRIELSSQVFDLDSVVCESLEELGACGIFVKEEKVCEVQIYGLIFYFRIENPEQIVKISSKPASSEDTAKCGR